MITPTDFVDLWKPSYPHATDNFEHGLRRMSRAQALEKLYIETCPKFYRNVIVGDLDITDSEWHLKSLIWDLGVLPEPNFTTINRGSGHAHFGYFTKGSVQTTKAIDYMKDIARGLQVISEGDPAYGGRTMRNPLHGNQMTIWGTDHLYSLKELHEYSSKAVILNKPLANEIEKGTGRNDALFEALRKWAYRERLKYTTYESWQIAAMERANELNFSLENPLTPSEVKTIAYSTVKWVWKKFNPETFSKIQKARSNKRAVVRNAPERDRAILDMVAAGFSVTEVSENLGVSYNAAKTAIYTARKRAASKED